MASDGAAGGSGSWGGSVVRLMLRVVSVSCVLSLFAVLELVEAMVVMSEADVRAQGDGGVEVT